MNYTIQATVARPYKGGVVAVQIPTFLLPSNTLGINNAQHAGEIAYDMLLSINPDAGVCVCACDEQARTAIVHVGNRYR